MARLLQSGENSILLMSPSTKIGRSRLWLSDSNTIFVEVPSSLVSDLAKMLSCAQKADTPPFNQAKIDFPIVSPDASEQSAKKRHNTVKALNSVFRADRPCRFIWSPHSRIFT